MRRAAAARHASRPLAACFTSIALLTVGIRALATESAQEPTVIVISWDGTRWDYPDRTSLPALERLERDGVRAAALVPVFPASTFPNHVSIATGAYVDGHGIVGNVFDDETLGHYDYSPDASFIDAEPLWVTAERQGVRAASFFWVGSETPWRGTAATYRKTPFDGSVGESEKVSQILAWLDLPESARPRLIMSWWHGADSAGHRSGPDAAAITEDLRGQDLELERLLVGLDERRLWASTTLLLVSDHGMTRAATRVDPLEPLAERGIEASLQGGGGFAYLTLEDPSKLDTALGVLASVRGLDAYASSALPPGLRARRVGRTGHITVMPRPPGAIFKPRSFVQAALMRVALWFDYGLRGAHGYDPKHRDMHAIFYAAGRGVDPKSSLGEVRTIDIAPTVTHLLGIDPPRDVDGRRIAGIGDRREP